MSLAETTSFLQGHHHIHREDKSGKEIHVFAAAGPPVFGGIDHRLGIDVEFPIGPIRYILKGNIDMPTLRIDAKFMIFIPFMGDTVLTYVRGDLKIGVPIRFSSDKILDGEATFYVKSDRDTVAWLTVDFGATSYGKQEGPYSIGLFSLQN